MSEQRGPSGERPIRVLLAKPGLDGHDRGVRVVARALRDAGMEVIYTGLRLSVDQILTIARDEDPDVLAVSILSGAHLGLAAKLIEGARRRGLAELPLIVGGTIPPGDAVRLKELGVAAVFGVGTGLDEIVEGVRRHARRRRGARV